MRMIGTLSNENQARRLAGYLKHKGIENSCDIAFDAQNGQMSYHIWVHDEDQIPVAETAFAEFVKAPSSGEYDVPIVEQVVEDPPIEGEEAPQEAEERITHRYGTHFTNFMLALCCFIFFLNAMEEIPLLEEGLNEQTFLFTPIQMEFLYDIPPILSEIEAIISKYKVAPNQKLETVPPEVKQELARVDKIPFFRGFYDWIVLKIKSEDTSLAEGPLFIQIRKGEFWRLFTPAILHSNLLHILFNMIWLIVLGRPIEQRIGLYKMALVTLLLGVFTNTLQYLMTGPFFLGYSGIVMGLAGFIWMRERVAPWEGYPLNRTTILFILVFIGSIFALQLFSFFLQLFSNHNFAPNIANTAHIAGAVIGAALGRSPFFSQRGRS